MPSSDRVGRVKCVVWDLDNTVWDGVLLEGDDVRLRDGVDGVIRVLDERGILHSIASRNDPDVTEAKLTELGIRDLFVYPQIGWGAKSQSVATIARELNIATDAIAFVDDDIFERDEVAAAVDGVLCLDATEIPSLPDRAELRPLHVTTDSRRRRSMVIAEIARTKDEDVMAPASFLRSLGAVMTVGEATSGDLPRVEELTVRTNQLNSTGYTYSFEELDALRHSPEHRLLIAGLEDRYGTYGKIGLALVELHPDHRLLRLLLVSCRVMARGAGTALLTHVLTEAANAGTPLRAEFIRTARNRPMYVMFRMAGFKEIERDGDTVTLEHDLSSVPPPPSHLELRILDPGESSALDLSPKQ